MTRSSNAAVLTAAFAIVVTACSGGEVEPAAVDRAVATTAATSVAPIRDAAELDEVLRSVDLEVDRAVALPGVDDAAFVVVVPGDSAIDAWRSARSLVGLTGRYPVIVGGPVDYGGDIATEFEQTLQSAEYLVGDGLTVESSAADADAVDLEAWFEARAEYLVVDDSELRASTPLPDYPWAKDRFTSATDVLSEEPLPFVEIALLPTPHSWEAPAFLLWGGWNDVPSPGELVAIFRRWSRTYGAEVVAMTGAVVEMTVPEPPATERDAIDLAREHFLVAPDNVWQGTGDLDLLAAAVLDAPVWYFWWD